MLHRIKHKDHLEKVMFLSDSSICMHEMKRRRKNHGLQRTRQQDEPRRNEQGSKTFVCLFTISCCACMVQHVATGIYVFAIQYQGTYYLQVVVILSNCKCGASRHSNSTPPVKLPP